ncbi:MAG: heavy-metal-associated domain-containing protein [Rhodocyclaceae bacterium]|nr:heavy-metal-associated domain-containing protein [Rhodocyclaceae bacterium]MDP1958072.1 heavy-metal-associated domain-containing protein [Rhodocyclaceae bacterium]
METTTIKVDGMSCGGCTASVTKVLSETPGVAKADVTLTPGQAVVEFDPARVTRAALCAAIDDAGFEAS